MSEINNATVLQIMAEEDGYTEQNFNMCLDSVELMLALTNCLEEELYNAVVEATNTGTGF